jgi:hypothetical protein
MAQELVRRVLRDAKTRQYLDTHASLNSSQFVAGEPAKLNKLGDHARCRSQLGHLEQQSPTHRKSTAGKQPDVMQEQGAVDAHRILGRVERAVLWFKQGVPAAIRHSTSCHPGLPSDDWAC